LTVYSVFDESDPFNVCPCDQRGNPVTEDSLPSLQKMRKRCVFLEQVSASTPQIQIEFAPPALQSDRLFATVSPAPERTDQAELELGLGLPAKLHKGRRRRGTKVAQGEKLVVPALLRQGQHLTNQLLGRPTASSDPIVFERLPPEKLNELLQDNVTEIGINLTGPELKAFEAAIKLLNIFKFRKEPITISPHNWFELFGVERYPHTKNGSLQFNTRGKIQALESLRSLSSRVMHLYYRKRGEDRTWDVKEDRIQLMRATLYHEGLNNFEVLHLESELTPTRLDKLRAIEISFPDIFFDQTDVYFILRPADMVAKVFEANDRKRLPDHLQFFLHWLLSDGDKRRRLKERQPSLDWVISQPLEQLARLCRMTNRLRHGERSRILDDLTRDAVVVKNAGYITEFDFSDEAALKVTLEPTKLLMAVTKTLDRASPDLELLTGPDPGRAALPTGGLRELIARGQSFPEIVREVSHAVSAHAAIRTYKELTHVARALQAVAKRCLECDVVVAVPEYKRLFIDAANRLKDAANVAHPGKYYQATLTNLVDQQWDAIKRSNRILQEGAERSEKAKRARAEAVALLESLAAMTVED
jgi:hypothetical protein